jgi:Spy/CpxP family protein refolding chaperone
LSAVARCLFTKEFKMKRQYLIAAGALAALTTAAALAQAQPGPGPRWFGDGPAMMGAYGMGHHYGPGRMAGYGPGGGGPATMNGACDQGAYGPGMMRGHWRGGMGGFESMGMGFYGALDLSDAQQTKLAAIRDEMRRTHWESMGKLIDERLRMRDLMAADKPDPAAVGKQSMKVAELQRKLLEARIEARNRMESLLTPEQKDALRNLRRRGLPGEVD